MMSFRPLPQVCEGNCSILAISHHPVLFSFCSPHLIFKATTSHCQLLSSILRKMGRGGGVEREQA